MIRPKRPIQIALAYLLIVAFLGFILRLVAVVDLPVNYRYIVHTHSHVALLGWVYTSLTSLIYFIYLDKIKLQKKYHSLFWFTQVTIIGMLISFSIEGYGLFSISFSTLFLLASYFFLWLFLKHTSPQQKQLQSYKLIRTGLWYMVFSSLGPWALGLIMNTLGSSSAWYKNAIYFFLHFQYNGWFILTLFGFLFAILEKNSIEISKRLFDKFYHLLNFGVLFTFLLSLLWMKPPTIVYIAAGIGGVMQLIAFLIIVRQLGHTKVLKKDKLPYLVAVLLITSGVFLFVKLISQIAGSLTSIAEAVSTNIELIIAYIHWVFLGVVSIAIFAFLHFFKLLRISLLSFASYLIGFLLMEGLLIYKGITVWINSVPNDHYYTWISIASLTLFLAIGFLLILQFKKKSIVSS